MSGNYIPGNSSMIRVMISAILLLLVSCASDRVEDRRHGQQLVCHDGDHTLSVSNADSFVHLNHGDSPGPCPGEDP
jgi:uncharacterized protein YcfL